MINQTSGIGAETRDVAARLAETGVLMFDAPVAGGVPAAKAGSVNLIAPGPDEACDKGMPILARSRPTSGAAAAGRATPSR